MVCPVRMLTQRAELGLPAPPLFPRLQRRDEAEAAQLSQGRRIV